MRKKRVIFDHAQVLSDANRGGGDVFLAHRIWVVFPDFDVSLIDAWLFARVLAFA
jgi:hypothetical protein